MKMGIPFSFKTIFFVALVWWSWQGFSQTPACAALSIPSNGGMNVSLDINFEWVASAGAESYVIVAGTSSGATDVLDNVNVGNVTEYDLPDNLPLGQTIICQNYS